MGAAIYTLAALLVLPVAPTAGAQRQSAAQRTEELARLIVYLEPWAGEEAGKLVRVESVAAVPEEGEVQNLDLHIGGTPLGEVERQRLLAAGSVPPGRYSSLQIELGTDESAEPVVVTGELPFRLQRGAGLVLNVTMSAERASGDAPTSGDQPSVIVRRPTRLPPAALAVVSSPDHDLLTFYDKVSGRAVGAVPTGARPMGVALDPVQRRAYVAVSDDDAVLAVDLSEHRVLASLRLRGRDAPSELVLTPDGNNLFVVNKASRTLSVIDAATLVEVDRLEVGETPEFILLDPSGDRAYVFDTALSGISVVDVRRRRVIGRISTDAEPFHGGFDRAGGALYVIHRWSPYLSVIDPSSFSVTERVFIGTPATSIEVDARTDLVYVSLRDSTSIDVYDPLALFPVDSIAVGEEIFDMTIDPENGHIHLLLADQGETRITRVVGGKPVATLELVGPAHRGSFAGAR